MRGLAEKQTEEMAEKNERKEMAKNALNDWYAKRKGEVENRKKANKESEWAFLQLREEHKKSKNPWE